MTFGDNLNVSGNALAALHIYDAEPARVERIRARCRAALQAQRLTRSSVGVHIRTAAKWLEPAIAFGLSAFYLLAAVGSSLALLH